MIRFHGAPAAFVSFPFRSGRSLAMGALGPCAAIALLAGLCGCVLTPEGTQGERDKATRDGAPYRLKYEDRTLPEFPPEPTWREVLQRAFLTNGELEAAYFEWRAALDRIDIAGAYPNTDVNLGFSYMFSSGQMKSFDRMTFSAGFDAMENLSYPGKTAQAAKIALDQARAAGERFRATKFDIQKRVLFAWADYVQHARLIEIKREDVGLRGMLATLSSIGAATGSGQAGAVESDVAAKLAQSEVDDLVAEHASMRSMLNALLHRDAAAPLEVARAFAGEKPREVPTTDAELVALAAETFPEVAVYVQELEGRRDALELARMRWIPDINPTLSFTGSIAQSIGAVIVLPTTIAEIRGRIREAESEIRAAEAMLRQRKVERIGEYVALLVTLRRAQEKSQMFRTAIAPAAQRIVDARTRAYEVGAMGLREVVESRQVLLETRVMIAAADAAAEKAVVDIECCLGVDIETLGKKGQSHE